MADRRQWGDRIPNRGPYTESSQSPSSLPSSAPSTPFPPADSVFLTGVNAAWQDDDVDMEISRAQTDSPSPRVNSLPAPAQIESPTLSSSQSNGAVTMASTINWTLQRILDQAPNFYEVDRIAATSGTSNLTEAITHHEREGLPLVIEGVHKHPDWPQHVFTLDEFSKGTSPGVCNPSRRILLLILICKI